MKISKLIGHENKKLTTPVLYTNIKKAVKTGNALLSYCKRGGPLGLAANQAGIMERVCVVKIDETFRVLIDPHIITRSGIIKSREGCLSLPGMRGDIQRPKKVLVDWIEVTDWIEVRKSGEYTGMNATIMMHVIEHLNGIRCIDKMKAKHMEGE